MNNIYKTYKVMLLPNNKQETKLFQFAGASRFIYNWTLEQEQKAYKENNKFLFDGELRKTLTKLKKQEDYRWLQSISNDVIKQAVKDACNAYKSFFNHKSSYPKFKSKRKSKPSFYQDTSKIQFTSTHVKLEKISNKIKKNRRTLNWIKLAEKDRIPTNVKYYNPRITYDGIHWWISVGIEEIQSNTKLPINEGIGIDLGIKDLAICSDGITYKNINKSKRVKKLEKRRKRLQRKLSRKIESQIISYSIGPRNGRIPHFQQSLDSCKNIIKLEKHILKIYHTLTNIRNSYIHQLTSEIVKREPSFICMEDLNIKGLMKNKYLSKPIQDCKWYFLLEVLKHKANKHNILMIKADRFYPSSKLCSCCGNKKVNLKLEDRIYKCENCGTILDRDYNASLNLRNYGLLNL